MERKRTIPCTDCEEWREDLELRGYRVISCSPIDSKPGFCLLRFEEATAPTAKQRTVKRIARVAGISGRAEMSRSRKVPRRLFDLATRPSKSAPRRVADGFLKKMAVTLGIAPDLADIRYDQTKQTILGSHVLYQQRVGRTDVSGAWLRVDIDPKGCVYNVQNDMVPIKVGARTAKTARMSMRGPKARTLSEEEARSHAVKKLRTKGTYDVLSSELVYRLHDAIPRLSWKVVVRTRHPIAEWKMYLDAITGQLLWKRNVLKKAIGRARVFDPNPVATLNDGKLGQRTRLPPMAYRLVELNDIANTGFLDGPYVSTRTTGRRVRRKDKQFLFDRGQRGFKEVMVYFHIDRAQRYIQSLGFTNVLTRPIEVNVDGTREDNSFYSPATKSLTFGTGGVDDAEDAEIILHEYGHAIQDDQLPGFGESDECQAMGEGFGDFLAGSFFFEEKPQRMRDSVGSWDAVAYSRADPPFLRRLDSNKVYPNDIVREEHHDGEIWSACLWELRATLGRTTTERIVLAHHYLLNRWASFEDAANALITVDKQLFSGKNRKSIRTIFVRRGILSK